MPTYLEVAQSLIQAGFVAAVDGDETVDILTGALAVEEIYERRNAQKDF